MPGSVPIAEEEDTSFKVVGYYPSWAMYRNPSFQPVNINTDLVTHINYAFEKLNDQGEIVLFDPWADIDHRTDWNTELPYWGNFKQLKELKEKNPKLKTLVSIGGWTLSDVFSSIAADPQKTQNFVNSSIQFCENYGFDGIDIDWEFPGFAEHSGRPEDKANYTKFLEALYNASKSHQPPLLVTIAAPAAPPHTNNIELDKIHNFVDWVNIMAYDYNGPWEPGSGITNFNAPLHQTEKGNPVYNDESTVVLYLSQGVPPKKIVLGMPLYGRSYAGVISQYDGLFSPYSGVGAGTTEEKGIRFFSDIKANLLRTYMRFWDEQSKVPYLFNANEKEFISYDDEDSLALKAQFVKEKQLGGAMVWDLSMDSMPNWNAMKAINQALKD